MYVHCSRRKSGIFLVAKLSGSTREHTSPLVRSLCFVTVAYSCLAHTYSTLMSAAGEVARPSGTRSGRRRLSIIMNDASSTKTRRPQPMQHLRNPHGHYRKYLYGRKSIYLNFFPLLFLFFRLLFTTFFQLFVPTFFLSFFLSSFFLLSEPYEQPISKLRMEQLFTGDYCPEKQHSLYPHQFLKYGSIPPPVGNF